MPRRARFPRGEHYINYNYAARQRWDENMLNEVFLCMIVLFSFFLVRH